MNTRADINTLPLDQTFARLCEGGLVHRLLELARDEDLGVGASRGDITSIAWSGAGGASARGDRTRVRLSAREAAVVSGLAAMPMLLELFASTTTWRADVTDGTNVTAGARLGVLEGPAAEVLTLERTLLNLVSRLSGIATLTSQYVHESAAGGRALVCDTRKTAPGLRMLEKYAVRCGGGWSHRLGLYDALLFKDNHIASCDSLEELASRMVRASRAARAERALLFVEAEADSIEQLDVYLSLPAGTLDVVLLDNMSTSMLQEAVARRDAAGSAVMLEASGGVNLRTIREIASTGVERISVGAITHGARSLDFGLDSEG